MTIKHPLLLRIAVALIALAPISFGVYGIFFGLDGFYFFEGDSSVFVSVNLDSHYRFLTAQFFTVGLAMAVYVARPNEHLLRWIACAFFLGGIARLASIAAHGIPSQIYFISMIIELAFPLLLLLIHHRLPGKN